MVRFAVAAILALCAGLAQAYDGWYVGAALHSTTLKTTQFGADFDLDLITAGFIGGYRFNPYIAVEGSFRTGIDDDSVTVGVDQFGQTVRYRAGLDNYFSATVLGRLPLGHRFELFGKAGYGRAAFSVRGTFADFSESDVTFGGGIQAQIGTVKVRAAYERLFDSGDAESDGWEIGVIYEL